MRRLESAGTPAAWNRSRESPLCQYVPRSPSTLPGVRFDDETVPHRDGPSRGLGLRELWWAILRSRADQPGWRRDRRPFGFRRLGDGRRKRRRPPLERRHVGRRRREHRRFARWRSGRRRRRQRLPSDGSAGRFSVHERAPMHLREHLLRRRIRLRTEWFMAKRRRRLRLRASAAGRRSISVRCRDLRADGSLRSSGRQFLRSATPVRAGARRWSVPDGNDVDAVLRWELLGRLCRCTQAAASLLRADAELVRRHSELCVPPVGHLRAERRGRLHQHPGP